VTPRSSPIWRSIADSLQSEIGQGLYRPGDKLPTEAELALRFGVNRHTVRHALAALAEAELVHSRRGAGVFVASRPTEYPLGRRVRFHQNIRDSGRTPSRKITRLETRPASAAEAEALAIAADALVQVIEGLSLADDEPIALFRSAFPAARLPGLLTAMTGQVSVSAALAACGVADFTRAETRITASRADALLAQRLVEAAERASFWAARWWISRLPGPMAVSPKATRQSWTLLVIWCCPVSSTCTATVLNAT